MARLKNGPFEHRKSTKSSSVETSMDRRLHLEELEARLVLSGASVAAYSQVSSDWFGPSVGLTHDVFGASNSEVSDSSDPDVESDRWIVRLTSDVIVQSPSLADAIALLGQSALPIDVVRGLGLPGQLLIETSAEQRSDVENYLSNLDAVAYFQSDDSVSAQATPNDSQFTGQAGLKNTGQDGGIPGSDINAEAAWDITTGDRTIVSAVIDTGVDFTHPDLAENIWINQGEIPAALRTVLIDTDNDGLITFVDLNDSLNSAHVVDDNLNGFIDAEDLLLDPAWANVDLSSQPIDDDGNGFANDLFGWDFRNEDNSPLDDHGHGTHIAGTLGAVGDNATGVTGVAWKSSIMVLKFLGENNAGFTSDAIEAINYATMMRTRTVDPVNLRLTNSSWGGNTFNVGLRDAIAASQEADILFVAAAGNGNNIFGGLDNDNLPFYPASYDLDNIISVAASDRIDSLARFSNFGETTVDLAAPGVGISSTELGGTYRLRNGTSMATPHVSGVAALVFSNTPTATSTEVKAAILAGVDILPSLQDKLVSDGRLNAESVLLKDTFSPKPQLSSAADITLVGTTPQTIAVEFTDDTAVDVSTFDDFDILVTRQDASGETFATAFQSVDFPGDDGPVRTAQYHLLPPGGAWDPADNGEYEISVVAGQVLDTRGIVSLAQVIGTFNVDVNNPGEFFVNSSLDTVDSNPGDGNAIDAAGNSTLRSAIQEANAQAGANTIFVASGTFALGITGTGEDVAASGDLDITDTTGTLTIVGAGADKTFIDAAGLDRIFDLHAGVTVTLSGVTLLGGNVTGNGGAVRSNDATLLVSDSTFSGNQASGSGGAIYVGTGSNVDVERSTLSSNTAAVDGGGIANVGTLAITNATFSGNTALGKGGGIHAATGTATIVNTTVTLNDAQTGGGIRNASGAANLHNTLVAENTATTDPDVAGNFTSLNNNLIGDVGSATGFGSGTGDLTGTLGSEIAPLLSPLQNSTGTTLTHVPLPGSPAIDTGDDTGAPVVDQRLVARPQDGNNDAITQVDIGAVERYFATISGIHFHDLDGSGIQDAGEPTLEGWTIYVDVNDNSQLDTGEPSAVTGADGSYTIGGVVPGATYNVRVIVQPGWEQTSPNVTASILLVTNTDDTGVGSLRQAIIDANNLLGQDIIQFAIGGTGPHTIQPLSALPSITDLLTIDGYTQAGASANTNPIGQGGNAVLMIELDGTNAGANADGLFIDAGGSTIRGLVINRFEGQAVDIRVGGGNVIEGNFIGTNVTGTSLLGSSQDGLLINSSNNLLGGSTPASRNILSGSSSLGVTISGNSNRVQGNFIGTDITGTQPLSSLSWGIDITGGTQNIVGIDGDENGDTEERNLISGNGGGVRISATGNIVAGNYIGTEVTGTTVLGTGNESLGIEIIGNSNRIGTDGDGKSDSLEGNIISGGFSGGGNPNTAHAINLNGDQTIIAGNYIGTDVTGLIALGNLGSGITASGDNNRIGTNADGVSDAEERNIVSGNGRTGIRVLDNNNIIAGNYIGVDATGTGAMGNGVSAATGGVVLGFSSSGNRVGSDVDGVRDDVEANVIAFNSGDGINVNTGGINNILRHNSIFSNTGLGIRVGLGPSFPTFTTVRSTGANTRVVGTFNSIPNTAFEIDFYANTVAGTGGFGQAERYLASTTLTTDGSGDASFNLVFAAATSLGEFVAATATDPQGFTSELSAATLVSGPITLTANSTNDAIDANPGDGVVDDGGGNATLRAAIMEANALAGDDTIQLSPGNYGLSLAGTGEDATLTGDLDITSNITIVGFGQGVTTIDANSLDRIFEVFAGASLILQGLTLTGGSAASGGAVAAGDAVPVTFFDVEFIANTSSGGRGGAINGFQSIIEVNDSTFTNNSTDQDGGAIGGHRPTITINNSTFTGNTATDNGGAIYPNGGTLTIDGSTFTGNQSANGSAIRVGDSTSPVVAITGSVFDSNIATDGTSRTITIRNPNGFVMISDTNITNNIGSGIEVGGVTGGLAILRSNISNNISSGASGAGVASSRPVTITDSTISGNRGGFGGGISNSHTTTILGSTISGNIGTTYGGGILNSGSTYITNSTISGNVSYGPGGGIKTNSANVYLTNTTITNNMGTTGGGISKGSATVEVINTIIAGNTGTSSDADVTGSGFTSQGNNLIGDIGSATGFTHGVNGDIVGDSAGSGVIDVLLGPLASNGGLTLTHNLTIGSPAIDAGTNSVAPATDQRGNPRPLDGDGDGNAVFDIGAVEFFDGFVVNSTADTVDANLGDGLAVDASGNTTLRAAIMEANALGGSRTIVLSSNTYTLSITGTGEDLAATGDLDVTADVTLVGNGADQTIVDAAGLDRVLDVLAGGSLALDGITIQDGDAGTENGGGIRNVGSLTISNSQITINATTGDGGGIHNGSTLVIDSSTLSANASNTGGGLFNNATATITNSTFSGNSAEEQGGGIYNTASGTANVTSTTITENSSSLSAATGNFAPLGGEFRVNLDTSGRADGNGVDGPEIASNGLGQVAVVWNTDKTGQDGVSGRFFENVNSATTAEFNVTEFNLNRRVEQSLDIDAAGNVTVAWQGFGQDAQNWGVRASRYDINSFDGTFFPSNYIVNVNGQSGTQGNPSVAVNSSGRQVIAWNGAEIHVQIYDSSNSLVGSNFQANSSTGGTQIRPQVAMNDNGEFVVAWFSDPSDTLDWRIHAQRFDAAGNKVGSEFQVNNSLAGTQRNPRIAMNNDAFVISWRDDDGGASGFGLYAKVYDINGNVLANDFRVQEILSTDHKEAQVQYLSDGTFYAVWEAWQRDGDLWGVYGQRFDTSGQRIGDEILINTTTTGHQHSPRFAEAEPGVLFVVWNGNGPGDGEGVFAQILEEFAFDGGGIANSAGGTFNLSNSIVAENTAGSILASPDITGDFTSLGNNLIGDVGDATGLTDGVNNDQVGDDVTPINPLLGPLQNNGGTTLTHLPLTGSPAIDAGNNSGAPATDQRGVNRVLDGEPDGVATIDVGAVEVDISGATFVVDILTDSVDANLGDGLAQDAGGNTSLRAAIQEANALAGFNTITLGPGTYTLTLSGDSENAAATGDLDITDHLNIVGAGANVTIIDASGLSDRAFEVFASQFVAFMGVTITGGTGVGFGSNADGGGILNSGTVRIEASTLANNTSGLEGGGLRNLSTGVVTIVDSTFSANTARKGGGIHSEGAVTITSSTFSANSTSTGGSRQGGAIYQEAGSLVLEASTLRDNTADDEGGGVYVQAGNVTAINTIVAGNISTSTNDADAFGTFTSLGNNFIGDIGSATGFTDGVNGDQVGDSSGSGAIDPLLGLLQDNGGTTLTHEPLLGSPLIDAGNNAQVRLNDQRGLRRILDGNGDLIDVVDIGAVEFFNGFIVNTTDDTIDDDPGDGLAEDAFGDTSLRAAIMEANALTGDRSILLGAKTYTLSLTGTELDNASVGDLDVTAVGSLTILGSTAGQTTIDAAGIDRVFHVFTDLRLKDLIVTGGNATAVNDMKGGGIYGQSSNLSLMRVSVIGNSANGSGGGIYNKNGSFQITDSVIFGNSANVSGGGVYSTQNNLQITGSTLEANSANVSGGGIFIDIGSVDITDSTIVGNTALSTSTGGGGLFVDGSSAFVGVTRSTISGNSAFNGGGVFGNDGELEILSSTISGNDATSLGGGIANVATLSIKYSTVTANDSGGTGGGISNFGSAIDAYHSIIAGNTASGGDPDIEGDFGSQGFNLVGVDDATEFAATGDLTGTTASPLNPLLGGLADNGGPTLTHALLAGSPAIEAGDLNIAAPPATDQRGLNRIEDSNGGTTLIIDIGAFELAASGGAFAASQDSTFAALVSSIPGDGVWTVTVGTGDAVENVGFGVFALPGEIRGHAFHDLDSDGVKDSFEPGLVGWEIYLDDNDNQSHDVGETLVVTDSNGDFVFPNLDSEQTYVVAEVLQSEWLQTFPTANNGSWTISLGAGETKTDVNFGNVEDDTGGVGTGDLEGVLFNDVNGNGTQEGGELGVPGETVYLDLNDNGSFDVGEPTQFTGATGTYLFQGLATGEYAVRVLLPSGGTQTSPQGVDNRPLTSTLETETQPNSLVSGDFNRDGHLDLAVVNAGNTTLSVFISDTNGSFLPAMIVNVGAAPLSIQAVQFDDDNNDSNVDGNDFIDLIVGYAGTNFISILFNDQNGGFTRSDFIAPYAPWYSASGDFDADGDIDVVTVHLNQTNVSFLERFGGGFISPAPTIGTGADPASLIAVQLSDDNSDSLVNDSDRLDLAWVDIFPGTHTVSALLNDGGGAFSRVTKNVGGRPFAVTAGDFDGDGFNDLAVTVPANNQVVVFLNNQAGNFSTPVFVSAGVGPTAITAADLDDDGDVDLVVTNASEEGFSLLRNDGAGVFTAEISGVATFPSPQAVAIIAGQLDNDPTIDIAIANGLASESVLFLANRLIDRANRVTVQNASTVSSVNFAIQLVSQPPSADFDSDNDVDGSDFLAWQRGFGTVAPNANKTDGDADDDSDVDSTDLSLWQTQYGTTTPPLAASSSNLSSVVSQTIASTIPDPQIVPQDAETVDAAVVSAFRLRSPFSPPPAVFAVEESWQELVRNETIENHRQRLASKATALSDLRSQDYFFAEEEEIEEEGPAFDFDAETLASVFGNLFRR